MSSPEASALVLESGSSSDSLGGSVGKCCQSSAPSVRVIRCEMPKAGCAAPEDLFSQSGGEGIEVCHLIATMCHYVQHM